jgi:glyoxylase-like metal-dependent hydrolase (beta-lactamase superfamily II)
MQLFAIDGNTQRLDGGAMFGNCPKPVWEKWTPPDAKNRIQLACRCLLIREASGRNVLLEAGIGMFFEPKMRERFGVLGETHALLQSLEAFGLRPQDIDVVVLSHLHFDHAGGLLTAYQPGISPALVFPRASYVVGAQAWARAVAPHARDRASFIEPLQGLIERTGKLERIATSAQESGTLGAGYTFSFSDGHTPGLMLTRVEGHRDGPMTFMGDLIPGAAWAHLPITMGYDRFPELLIDEKRAMLDRVIAEHGWAFFTHDPEIVCARIQKDAQGKYGAIDAKTCLDGN